MPEGCADCIHLHMHFHRCDFVVVIFHAAYESRSLRGPQSSGALNSPRHGTGASASEQDGERIGPLVTSLLKFGAARLSPRTFIFSLIGCWPRGFSGPPFMMPR